MAKFYLFDFFLANYVYQYGEDYMQFLHFFHLLTHRFPLYIFHLFALQLLLQNIVRWIHFLGE